MNLQDKNLKIEGSISANERKIEATGKINNDRFYFIAFGNNWEFSVATENCLESNPRKINSNNNGYYIRGEWNDKINKAERLNESKKIILNATKEFLDFYNASNKKYQKRFIAFIDILGFKSIVTKTASDIVFFNKILNAIKDLRNNFLDDNKSRTQKLFADIFFEMNPDIPDYKTQITQISDCIIVSKLAHVPGALEELVLDASFAIHMLISHGLLCKGSIAFGKVFHNKDYIIGPGYNMAYLGEQVERYPAISFSEDVYKLGLKRRSPNKITKDYFDKYIINHKSGNYFIDYFNDLEFFDLSEDARTHYKKLKAIIVNGYRKADSEKIKEKYEWATLHYNESSIVRNGYLKKIVHNHCNPKQ